MTRPVVLLPPARDDIAEAMRWYRERGPGLDRDFLRRVEETMDRIGHDPLSFPRVHSEFRRALSRRFPYAVVYRTERHRVVVVSVLHTSRDPRIWHSRGH